MKYEDALLMADNVLAQGQPLVLLRHRIAEALVAVAPKSHEEHDCHVCDYIRERAALGTTA